MHDVGSLIEGLFIAALGAFMVFAPDRAERVNRQIPFIRTGGALRAPVGWVALIIGVAWVIIWLINQF
jgi:hypothetical protein